MKIKDKPYERSGKNVVHRKKGRDEFDIGPGSYDPYKYEKSGNRAVFSRNFNRMKLEKTDYKAGPADYNVTLADTRIWHAFGPRDRTKVVAERPKTPPLGGNLAHESWIKTPPPPPKTRFPQTKFSRNNATPQFASRARREVFAPKKDEVPDPGSYCPKATAKKYRDNDGSPPFRNCLERFGDSSTPTPSPCAYTINNGSFGSGPAFSFHPLMPQRRKTEEDNFEPPQSTIVRAATPSYTKPKFRSVLGENIQRKKPERERMPDVGDYNIDVVCLSKTAPLNIMCVGSSMNRWDATNTNPGPGHYNPQTKSPKRDRYARINRATHSPYDYGDRKIDSHGAFVTKHGDFIIRSSNKRYNPELEKWR